MVMHCTLNHHPLSSVPIARLELFLMITEAGNSLDLLTADEGRQPNDSSGVGLNVDVCMLSDAVTGLLRLAFVALLAG